MVITGHPYSYSCSGVSEARATLVHLGVTSVIFSGNYMIVTLGLRQNGCSFADNIFKLIYLQENFCVLNKFHSSWFLKVQLTINQHLVQMIT